MHEFRYKSYTHLVIKYLGREDKIEEASHAHTALADLAGSNNDFATLLSVYSGYHDRYFFLK